MTLLGAGAHELLRTHLNSSALRDNQALPVIASKDVAVRNPTKLLRVPQLSFHDLTASSVTGYGENSHQKRRCRVHSTSNSSASAASALQQQVETLEEGESEVDEEITKLTGTVTSDPSCPLPDFRSRLVHVALLDPLQSTPPSKPPAQPAPLLVYVPGMDCSGQGIRRQLPSLVAAGYDIRCVFIPSDNRSSWQQLVQKILPFMEKEAETSSGKPRHVTVLGESFGGSLAIRLAQTAPHLVSRLVLINPATNFPESNVFASVAARTGLLAAFPQPLYQVAQDILLPLMVRKGRVSRAGNEDMLSPIDYVPAQCAAWRFSMLNDSTGLSNREIREITVPTLLFASAKDRVLWSTTECLRLQKLFPNCKRIIMAESGHTLLFEDSVDLAYLLDKYGFSPPHSEMISSDESPTASKSNGASHSKGESEQASNRFQPRKHAVPVERYDEMGQMMEPWRILTSPHVTGAESLPNPEMKPKRPVLFVGNHTIFGLYDSFVLVHELYTRGFRARGLAHPDHWKYGVGPLFERYGHVKVTKFSAYKLFKDGEDVLLFPGGAREVFKRKGEEYKLIWKETVDFVRMATRWNAIIIPFGILGADDAYKLLYDGNEILNSPVGPLVSALYERLDIDLECVYPLTSLPGLGLPSPVPIPSVERIYIHFAEPVDTQQYKCNLRDKAECKNLYMLVKGRVEDSISLLKKIREQDHERSLPTRLWGKIRRLLPERKPSF